MPDSVTPCTPGGVGHLAGCQIARIGYGAMQLGRSPRGARDDQHCLRLLRQAYVNGVNHIDTAEFYSGGHTNTLIRGALHPYPDDLVIVSKVGATSDPLAPQDMRLAQRPAELRAEVEANLRTLGLDAISVVNLRRLEGAGELDTPEQQIIGLDDQLAEMIALRDEGKIEAIGLSGVTGDEIIAALPAGIVCVQNSYSVLDRGGEELLKLCSDHDIAWVPFFPLVSSDPTTRSVIDDRVVRAVAAALHRSPAQIGLAWLLARDPHILLIPGTADLEHLRENLAAGHVALDERSMAALDDLAADTTSPTGAHRPVPY